MVTDEKGKGPGARAGTSGAPTGSSVSGILVLGMHRSGTSPATRAVNLLGVPVGPEEELKGGSPVNPTGFWEVKRLTAFNDRILHRLGGGWTGPPPREAIEEAARDQRLIEQARVEFDAVFGTYPSWVWKDPRTCVLLPVWLATLRRRPAVLLVHRNPLEICRSLEARDDFPRSLALALWERYLRDALLDAAGLPVLVQSYEDLLREPAAAHAEQAAFLDRHGIARPDAGDDEQLRSFLDLGLRHTTASAETFADDPAPTPSQRALFAALEGLRGEHVQLREVELPPMDEESKLLLKRYGREQGRIATLRGELQEAQRTLAQAQRTIERLTAIVEKRDQKRKKADGDSATREAAERRSS